jgi:glycoside/pentoside/hexuronide:cation symporter, GPH family
VLIVGLFVKRMEKKWNFIMWFSIATACNLSNYWMGPGQVEWILITNALSSLATAPVCVLIWAMYSDAAEYSEWKNNRQAAGLVFSASTFAQQLGWGFGPAFAAWMLDRYGYVPNVAQGSDVLHGMVLLVSIYSAVFGVLAIIFMLMYPLTDQRVHEMSAELKLRREKASATSA